MVLFTPLIPVTLTAMAATDQVCRYKFTAVPGIFTDHAARFREDNTFKGTTLPLLGLIDRDYGTTVSDPAGEKETKPWERLRAYVQHLNRDSPGGTSYKVLFLTRHGFGFHNEAEAKFGTRAWNVSTPILVDAGKTLFN